MSDKLSEMVTAITGAGTVSAKDAAVLREVIYADGVIDKEEAEALFTINDAVSGKDNDAGWKKLFVAAVTKFVLADEVSPGEVDDDEAAYLIQKMEGDGQIDDVELATLVNITKKAKSCTAGFNAFVLKCLEGAILEDGIIDADEVEMIKDVIYGTGGGGGEGVDKDEADFLFRLNDAVSGKENSPLWGELFAEAITAFVLADDTSPGEVDDDEAAYLIQKIEGDGQVDAVELATLVSITKNAKSCTDGFNAFVIKSLEGAILEDGIIDADEVQMIKDVIYGTGGGGGEGVDKDEAEFLFRLNDAVSGKENSPQWGELFVEALTKFVLEDEVSPGEIDADEAKYLIEKIMADGQVDDVERALLVSIKNNAKEIHADLKAKMDELGI